MAGIGSTPAWRRRGYYWCELCESERLESANCSDLLALMLEQRTKRPHAWQRSRSAGLRGEGSGRDGTWRWRTKFSMNSSVTRPLDTGLSCTRHPRPKSNQYMCSTSTLCNSETGRAQFVGHLSIRSGQWWGKGLPTDVGEPTGPDTIGSWSQCRRR